MSEPSTTVQPLEYADYIKILRGTELVLAAEFAECHGVEQVLQWLQQRDLTKPSIDIVGQDEFHYDFLVEFGPGGRWLVFGVT